MKKTAVERPCRSVGIKIAPAVFFACAVLVAACGKSAPPAGKDSPAPVAKAVEDDGASKADLAPTSEETDLVVNAFADQYREQMLTIPDRLASVSYAEELAIEMALLDPGNPRGSAILEKKLAENGLDRARIVGILERPGTGRRLTERVREIKKTELKPVYEKMEARALPSMIETPQGCKEFTALLERAYEECVSPTTLGILHMKRTKCAAEDGPALPSPEEYARRCEAQGALWTAMLSTAR